MIVCVNGRMVPESEAVVSCFDRGFLYGDGVFETLLVRHGRPFRWASHMERMKATAGALGLALPKAAAGWRETVDDLVEANGRREAVLRIAVSRGVGPRGYSIRGADRPTWVMSLHPAPAVSPDRPVSWRLLTVDLALAGGGVLAGHKTANQLWQVLARRRAEEAGMDEALMVNETGQVVEAAGANVFWAIGETLHTPPLALGALAGVTRRAVMEWCEGQEMACREAIGTLAEVRKADGVFLTLSTYGVVEAVALDGGDLNRTPLTARMHRGLQSMIDQECGEQERV